MILPHIPSIKVVYIDIVDQTRLITTGILAPSKNIRDQYLSFSPHNFFLTDDPPGV
jgi:hypothetical protein